jgi:hypothetical protein
LRRAAGDALRIVVSTLDMGVSLTKINLGASKNLFLDEGVENLVQKYLFVLIFDSLVVFLG